MASTKTIHFIDPDTNDAGFILLRRGPSNIGLTLSLENDGDIEVFIGLVECMQLIRHLQELAAEFQAVNTDNS